MKLTGALKPIIGYLAKIYKNQIDSEIELVQFMSSLTNDINYGTTIKSRSNEIIIERTNGKQVVYKFKENKVLRTIERVDTFLISTKKMGTHSFKDYDLNNKIDFDIIRGAKVSSFSLIKNYSNATIVNQEIKQSEYGN